MMSSHNQVFGGNGMSSAGDGNRTCRNCNIVFPSKNALHRHIRIDHQASASASSTVKVSRQAIAGGAVGGGFGIMGVNMGMGGGQLSLGGPMGMGGGMDQHILPLHMKMQLQQV